MEPQNQPIQNPQPIMESAKKCNHLPAIIILTILTITGLAFGGFELWQNMQLNSNIQALQTENNTIKQNLEELAKLEEEKIDNNQKSENDNQQDEVNDENSNKIPSQDELRIAILDSGKVCVVDVDNSSVVVCAEDVEEKVKSFDSCDSGNGVLNCMVSTLENKKHAKFIYNRENNTFTHGKFMED